MSGYKFRLKALHLDPLMMVYELNDLSFLWSLSSLLPNHSIFRTMSPLVHHPLVPLVYFVFTRLPFQWNSLPTLDLHLSSSQTILLLKKFFWSQFLKHFNSSNLCSNHFRCPCNKWFMSSPASRFIPGSQYLNWLILLYFVYHFVCSVNLK